MMVIPGSDLVAERPVCLAAGDARRLDPHQVAFWFCCAYVVSQIYLVPVLLIGPSWSVWPSLTDLVVAGMVMLLPFLRGSANRVSADGITIQRLLILLAVCAAVSYVGLTLNLLDSRPAGALNDKGPSVGLYQLYRVAQYLTVFFVALRLKLPLSRRQWLCRAVGFTFWISSLLLMADYFRIVTTPELAPQIPTDLGISGPWAFYARGTVGQPVGTMGFHHVYPSVQLLVLAALYLYLLPVRRFWLDGMITATLWTCGFIGGGRAGFVAICVFCGAVVVSHFRRFVAISLLGASLMLVFLWRPESFTRAFSEASARQGTITSSYEEDGLAGRVEIWNDRLALLNESVLTWVVGTGFGSAIESGDNGHMLYLHITLECGLIGLLLFLSVIWRIMSALWKEGRSARLLWCATGALLLSAVTQETLYPVPALSHFCGLFLFSVAIAIRRPAGRVTYAL